MTRKLTPEEREAWAELAEAERAVMAARERLIAITDRISQRDCRLQRLRVIDGGRGQASNGSNHQAGSVA